MSQPLRSHDTESIRNIAILGHAGSGKTTLIEALLAKAGEIRSAGSVEKGSTVCDFTDQEKRLRHSLDVHVCHLHHAGREVNLLDTPGYPDFIGRALAVLPAVETAAVVVNAECGAEMVTQRIMTSAAERKLCRLIIVNKIDAGGANLERVLADIRERFGRECLPLNLPARRGEAVADCFFAPAEEAPDFSSVATAHREITDRVVELDDALMDRYLEQGEELASRGSARAVRARAARRSPDPGLLRVCQDRRGAAPTAARDDRAHAESVRGQSGGVPRGPRRPRADGRCARRRGPLHRPRVQAQRRSVRRPARSTARAPGRDPSGRSSVHRRQAQAREGRASLHDAGQGAARSARGRRGRFLRRREDRGDSLRRRAALEPRRRRAPAARARAAVTDASRRDRSEAARPGEEALRRAAQARGRGPELEDRVRPASERDRAARARRAARAARRRADAERLRSRGRDAAAEDRVPRDGQASAPTATAGTRSRPAARASSARCSCESSRCARGAGFEFVERGRRRRDPDAVHPGRRERRAPSAASKARSRAIRSPTCASSSTTASTIRSTRRKSRS